MMPVRLVRCVLPDQFVIRLVQEILCPVVPADVACRENRFGLDTSMQSWTCRFSALSRIVLST